MLTIEDGDHRCIERVSGLLQWPIVKPQFSVENFLFSCLTLGCAFWKWVGMNSDLTASIIFK